MSYRLLVRSIWFVAGVTVVQALHPALAHGHTASDKVEVTTAHKSSAAASSSVHVAHSNIWTTAGEPYVGAGAPHWRYFVEFRARNAASYGHVYVMWGEVNARHEVIKSDIAGLFPAGDAQNCANCSIYNWAIGHVLPVPSEIGASDGDLEEQYVLARFRVWVDENQYKRVTAYVNERKADKGPWNAFFANCVSFGRDVANVLKLDIPPNVALGLVYPQGFVEALREANGLKHEQLPLRDAGRFLPEDGKTIHQTKVSPAEGAAKKTAQTQ